MYNALEQDDTDYRTESGRHASRHFAPEEDERLRQLVSIHGARNWPFIAAQMHEREAKQCRERWLYHLAPEIKKGKLSDREWALVLDLQKELGNRWSEIARHLPGRSPNQIKNHWHTNARKPHGEKKVIVKVPTMEPMPTIAPAPLHTLVDPLPIRRSTRSSDGSLKRSARYLEEEEAAEEARSLKRARRDGLMTDEDGYFVSETPMVCSEDEESVDSSQKSSKAKPLDTFAAFLALVQVAMDARQAEETDGDNSGL